MGRILDGKAVAEEIRDEVKSAIRVNEYKITLAVIQVGDDPASSTYIKNKEKACNEVGIEFRHFKFNESLTEKSLKEIIARLNDTKEVTGILVQLPLPKHINEINIVNSISSWKDVDGFTNINRGKLYSEQDCLKPCTPAGVMELLHRYNIPIWGKNALVLGRSHIVGRPMAEMLLQEDAVPIIGHSQTKRLDQHMRSSQIIVSAIGKPKFITQWNLTGGQVLIDVGINRDENGKLCGDFEAEACAKSEWYTPVPGGVGPMTIAMLMKNCLKAYKMQRGVVNE